MRVLAIDQGTTNTKALLVEQGGAVVATSSRAVPVTFPQHAWVEQDADAIWAILPRNRRDSSFRQTWRIMRRGPG